MRDELLTWIRDKHQGQMIRKTDEPYVNHLLFVADKADAYIALGYEIGLCHDLLEETSVTTTELLEQLSSIGYDKEQAAHITTCVTELTDVYIKTAFPDLHKKERKKMEALRLTNISPDAQTVKYADLIYNINWTAIYEIGKAKKYLHKKEQLITAMIKGHERLRAEALSLIENLSQ